MKLDVNANRMELMRLKKRLGVARRGHKLLKDKLDELMRRFLEIVQETQKTRTRVEASLEKALREFTAFYSTTPRNVAELAVELPGAPWQLETGLEKLLNVRIPHFELKIGDAAPVLSTMNVGLTFDLYLKSMLGSLGGIVKLAQLEKRIEILAVEIEKTRRRVNALEYVLIPNILDTIKYIRMKLDELERGNLTRLMKVKQMLGK